MDRGGGGGYKCWSGLIIPIRDFNQESLEVCEHLFVPIGDGVPNGLQSVDHIKHPGVHYCTLPTLIFIVTPVGKSFR
jgi:hypothetical protein